MKFKGKSHLGEEKEENSNGLYDAANFDQNAYVQADLGENFVQTEPIMTKI